MYCVYQVDDKYGEKIIKIIKSKGEFLESVKIKNCVVLNDTNIKQLKNNDDLGVGFYMLNGKDDILLVEKYNVVEKGYVYNSFLVCVKLLCTWRLIAMDMDSKDVYGMMKGDEVSDGFDFGKVDCETSNLIVGDVYAGKNLLIGKLIDDKLKLNYAFDIMIISKNPNVFYKTRYPGIDINYGNDIGSIKNYMTGRLIKMKDEVYNSKGIVILDDWDFNKDDDIVKHLMYNYRHYGITLIVGLPFDHDLKPEYKATFNYKYLLHTNNTETQIKLCNKYGHMFKTFIEFKNAYVNNGLVLNGDDVHCLKNY